MLNPESESEQQQNEDKNWCVLYHLNPNIAEVMLRKDSNGEFATDEEPALPPYRFYIPFQYMPIERQRVGESRGEEDQQDSYDDRHYDPYKDDRALRNDLHTFVFIQAPLERVMSIVRSRWNREARLHFFLYRDTDGREVRIPDAEMQMLIHTLQDRHLKFYLDQPVSEFSVGDQVILQREPWVGQVAELRNVRVRKSGIQFTVSMNILGRTKSITFPNVSLGDVRFVDEEQGRFLSGNPVTNYEEEMLDLLSHRFTQKNSEDLQKNDQRRLQRLASYTHIYVEDQDDDVRFKTMQLLCAYLRSDKKTVETIFSLFVKHFTAYEVSGTPSASEQHSSAGIIPATIPDVYRMIGLFVVTRNPQYRDAVKDYRRQFPDSPDTIRRFISILKSVKTKKPVLHQ